MKRLVKNNKTGQITEKEDSEIDYTKEKAMRRT